MQTKTLYKYTGTADGKAATIVSPVDIPYARPTEMYRLIADEGYVLTNDGGETYCSVIDIEVVDLEAWSEMPDPELGQS